MIKNIRLLVLCILTFFTFMACDRGTPPENYTIGVINLNKNLEGIVKSLKKGLAKQGYKPGINTTYLYDGALNSPKQIKKEVMDMLAADVDMFITMTTPATKAVKNMEETSGLPILFFPVYSPVNSGIVDSIAAPGGNITGIKIRGGTGKTLEWFTKAVPSVKSIFVPFHHTDNAAKQTLEDLRKAADFLNIEIITANLETEKELEEILDNLPGDIDGIWVTHSHLIISNLKKIIAKAIELNIPTASSSGQAEKGVMVCFAPQHEAMGKQASKIAGKILQGVSASSIPVETSEFFLSLNLKTAQAIGIKIPSDVISQADLVIR